MPFKKIQSGQNKGKYKSPSGNIFTPQQVKLYHATKGTFKTNKPIKSTKNK
jgi:hypothetical protein